MTTKWSVGIDYSMTCPAMCLWMSDRAPRFWYAIEHKGHKTLPARVEESPFQWERTSDWSIRRFQLLAQTLIHTLERWIHEEILLSWNCEGIFLEDYAFAARGRVFNIGENGGILKLLWLTVPIHPLPSLQVVAPTAVKKSATGKGNADKAQMVAAFIAAHPDAATWSRHWTKKVAFHGSPLADLADSYHLARYR